MTDTLSVSPFAGSVSPTLTTTALPTAAVANFSAGIDSYVPPANFVANPNLRPAGELARVCKEWSADERGLVRDGVAASRTHERAHDIGQVAELGADILAGSRSPFHNYAPLEMLRACGDGDEEDAFGPRVRDTTSANDGPAVCRFPQPGSADDPATCRFPTTQSAVQTAISYILEGLSLTDNGEGEEAGELFERAGRELFQLYSTAPNDQNAALILLAALLAFDGASNSEKVDQLKAELAKVAGMVQREVGAEAPATTVVSPEILKNIEIGRWKEWLGLAGNPFRAQIDALPKAQVEGFVEDIVTKWFDENFYERTGKAPTEVPVNDFETEFAKRLANANRRDFVGPD